MAAYWTVLTIPVTCGSADGEHEVPAGHPVRVGPGCVRRCEVHAHVDVDWAQVEAARHRIDAAAAEDAARREREPQSASAPRFRRPRPVQPADFVRAGELFDPKALAAGDREDR